MQYIFLSHDVDWRKQGPMSEHILNRKDRFDPEIFASSKPKELYRNISEYMQIEERFGIRSTFFFRTFYENGNVDDYENDIQTLLKGNWEIGLHTDPQSVEDVDKIKGTEIDYIVSEMGEGFRINNPNPAPEGKKGECGCGSDSSCC